MENLTFFEAIDEASKLLAVSGAVALLQGAHESSLLSALTQPTTPEALAERTGLPPERIDAVCEALAAFDVVVTKPGGAWQLGPVWATFLRPDALIALSDILGLARVEADIYRELGRGGSYWELSSEDRLAYARGVSPNPFAQELVSAFGRAAEIDPDSALLQVGGDYLEFGCGIAGRILTCLQAFPALRAVGVELAADLAAEARRRAQLLAVDDRFEVVVGDAGKFDRPSSFDFGFWSQFFFPEPARQPALAALFRAVRPGGVVWAPLVTDFERNAANPTSTEARHYRLRRVLLGAWGVPERDFEALKFEFAAAGFQDIQRTGGGDQGPVRLRALRP